MCIINNRQFSYAVNLTFAVALSFTSACISFARICSFSAFFAHCLGHETEEKTTSDVEFGCRCCCRWWCCFDCCIRTTNFVVRNLTFHFLCRLSSFQTITFVSFLFFSTMSFEFQRHTLLEWCCRWCCCCAIIIGHGLYRRIRSLMIWMTCEKEITHAHTSRFLIREKEWDGF